MTPNSLPPPRSSGVLTIPGAIPIRIHPLFWLMAAFISFINAPTWPLAIFLWIPTVFVSILVHELGHALTAKAFGQQVYIELIALGGLTYRSGKPLKLWQDFIVVLNGPLAGASLCLLGLLSAELLSSHSYPLLFYLSAVVFTINALWSLFNLLPIYPLDGGHLLRTILQGILGTTGIKMALFFSMLFAIGISGLSFYYGQLLVGSIFLLFCFESYRNFRASLRLKPIDEDIQLQQKLTEAQAALSLGDVSQAERSFEHIIGEAKEGVIHLEAIEQLAELYLRQEQYVRCYELLKPYLKKISQPSLERAQIAAYYSQKFDEALEIGKKLWRDQPSAKVASLNAFCHAAKGQAEQAVAWLSSLAEENGEQLKLLLPRPELDPIRQTPLFRQFCEGLDS